MSAWISGFGIQVISDCSLIEQLAHVTIDDFGAMLSFFDENAA